MEPIEITTETLFAKIGALVIENEALKQQLQALDQTKSKTDEAPK